MEKVSIIMCTYNGERYLDAQIQSILGQIFTDFHLIIGDDCSSDKTYEILQKWKSKYPSKITLFKQERNIGYNENFARTISLATGDYVMISDQDDVWLPNKVGQQVAYMEKFPDVILTHHKEEKLINGEVQKEEVPLIRWAIDYEGKDFRRFVLINVIAGHQIMFRKLLLDKIQPFPAGSDYVYDWWISTVALLHGRIGYLNEVLLYHRLHENNTWFTFDRSVNKITTKKSFYDGFIDNRYKYLKELKLDKKNTHFIEKLRIILLERRETNSNKKLFYFLLRYRKHIFPVKARYAILAEYAYIKRCFAFCRQK